MENADVDQEGFSEAVLGFGRQREAVGRGVRDDVAEPSRGEPLEGGLGLLTSNPLAESRVDDLLAEVTGDGEQGGVEQRVVQAAAVFGEIGPVGGRQILLQGAELMGASTGDVGGDHGWQASHHGVAFKPPPRLLVGDGGERRPWTPRLEGLEEYALAVRLEVFVEAHGLDVTKSDSTDGHAHRVVGERELEQRARSDDRQLGHFLIEPAQLRQQRIRCLDLVEKEERAAGLDRLSHQQREFAQDPLGIVALKGPRG